MKIITPYQHLNFQLLKILIVVFLSVLSATSLADFDCEFALSSKWSDGAVANIHIKNSGDTTQEWSHISALFPDGVIVSRRWNSSPIKPGDSNGTFYPADWNNTLEPGMAATIGMQLSFASETKSIMPTLAGDCSTANLPPSVTIECHTQTLYGDILRINSGYRTDFLDCSADISDPENDALTYSWNAGDGSDKLSTQQFRHSYVESGEVTVSLTVDDGTNTVVQHFDAQVIGNGYKPEVEMECHVVDANVPDGNVPDNHVVQCDATISDMDELHPHWALYWGDDSILSEWSDQSELDSSIISYNVSAPGTYHYSFIHHYSNADEYLIYLSIWDSSYFIQASESIVVGASSTLEINDLTCNTITMYGDNFIIGAAVEVYSMECRAQVTQSDNRALEYTWVFGDGTAAYHGASSYASHRYVDSDEYTITVRVSDGMSTSEKRIDVTGWGNGVAPEPVLRCSESNLTVSCDLEGFFPDGSQQQAAIEWGDGEISKPVSSSFSHDYSEGGSYTITAYVWNKHHLASDTKTMILRPVSKPELACSYELLSSWGSRFMARIDVKNVSGNAINGWGISLAYDDGSTIDHVWNGALSGDNPFLISENNWNGSIAVGQSISIGISGSTTTSESGIPRIVCGSY